MLVNSLQSSFSKSFGSPFNKSFNPLSLNPDFLWYANQGAALRREEGSFDFLDVSIPTFESSSNLLLFAGWFYVDAVSQRIIRHGDSGADRCAEIYVKTDELKMRIADDYNGGALRDTSLPITVSEGWHHVVFVLDRNHTVWSQGRAYVNGAYVGKSSGTNRFQGSTLSGNHITKFDGDSCCCVIAELDVIGRNSDTEAAILATTAASLYDSGNALLNGSAYSFLWTGANIVCDVDAWHVYTGMGPTNGFDDLNSNNPIAPTAYTEDKDSSPFTNTSVVQAQTGDSIYQLTDLSGNSDHMTQDAIDLRPLLEADGSFLIDGLDDQYIWPQGLPKNTEYTAAVIYSDGTSWCSDVYDPNNHSTLLTAFSGANINRMDQIIFPTILNEGIKVKAIFAFNKVASDEELDKVLNFFGATRVVPDAPSGIYTRYQFGSYINKMRSLFPSTVSQFDFCFNYSRLIELGVDLPICTGSNGYDYAFSQCTRLTSWSVDIDCSNQARMRGMFYGSTSLSSFTGDIINNGTCNQFDNFLSNCALDQASVDHVLTQIEAHGLSNGKLDIHLGTNATPSATGQAAADALRARGWVVQLNGY